MLITNHVLTGAAIGLAMPRRPVAAAITGLASHFALDSLPHWGSDDRRVFLRVAVADGLCGLATAAVVYRRVPRARSGAVLAAMFGSCLPDADKPALLFFHRSPFPRSVDQFHARMQREAPDRLPREARVAAALGGVAAVATGVLRRR